MHPSTMQGKKNQIFSSWQHQLEEHQIVSIDHHQIFRPSNIEKESRHE